MPTISHANKESKQQKQQKTKNKQHKTNINQHKLENIETYHCCFVLFCVNIKHINN